MRLFYPHLIGAMIVLCLSILGAYLVKPLVPVLGVSYPLLWKAIGLLCTLMLGLIGWVACVRAIEYHNLYDYIKPSLATNVKQRTFLETVDFLVFRERRNLQFLVYEIQKARGSHGRRRVVQFVMEDALAWDRKEVQDCLDDLLVTRILGTSWKAYFWPAW